MMKTPTITLSMLKEKAWTPSHGTFKYLRQLWCLPLFKKTLEVTNAVGYVG
jgi:hypothetical protein